jgi:hypothetical protein
LGGADSVHQIELRKAGVDWWPEERVSLDAVNRLRGERVDLLVTHTPPASTVLKMGIRTPTQSADRVEYAWRSLGYPPLVCGHHHRRFRDRGVSVIEFLGYEIIR